ncbi:MAG TPA: hypothetical protein VI844_03740, partial [Coxiellaceae bacterium]|nr:hypothetical protein [Coxiellaceae bacterium]
MMKALLRGLLLFLILFFALLTFLLTPTGLRLSIETSGYFLPGKLSVKKISGVIIGPLTVEQFHYQDARQTIDIKKLYLNWRPLDLFKKQLHVHSLDVQGLHIITNNSNLPREWTIESLQQTAKALLASLQRRTLPFHGVIEHARFSDIQITNEIEKTKTEIPKLHLRAVITATVWDANVAASIKKPLPVELRFILQGSPTNHAMHFTLIGHHTHWELTGIGDAESLTIHTLKKLLLGGTYDMEFYIHWENALTWDGKIIANHMDLSLLNALWEKSLSITLNSTGTDHHLSLDELTTENNATITTSNGSVHLTVQRKNKWHIQWNGHIQQIESHGKIEGDLLNPYFEAELHGQSQEGKKISSAKLALLGNFTHHTLSAQFIAPQQKINIKVIG